MRGKNGLFSPPMLNCFYIGLVLSLMRMEVPRNLTSFYYSQKTRACLVQVLKEVFFVKKCYGEDLTKLFGNAYLESVYQVDKEKSALS
jgi:hypothetical protein